MHPMSIAEKEQSDFELMNFLFFPIFYMNMFSSDYLFMCTALTWMNSGLTQGSVKMGLVLMRIFPFSSDKVCCVMQLELAQHLK